MRIRVCICLFGALVAGIVITAFDPVQASSTQTGIT